MLGTALRNCCKRCHGHSRKKRMETSKVAPPHISNENTCGFALAKPSATASISSVRTRVASSDWCASRNVVSVYKILLCCRIQLQKASGPISSSLFLLPLGYSARRSKGGMSGLRNVRLGSMVFTSGLPLTVRLAMYRKVLVARSKFCVISNSSGCSSINATVALPDVNVGW